MKDIDKKEDKLTLYQERLFFMAGLRNMFLKKELSREMTIQREIICTIGRKPFCILGYFEGYIDQTGYFEGNRDKTGYFEG
jgi:hypothetical protein